MIRQNGNNRRTGRSNEGRKLSEVERQNNRNYSRIPIISDLTDMLSGGGGQPEMQTTTQQNLPSWAIPDAMSTLGMGNYYTQNPDYRASTLDRDYSGIRGGASGVGQVGLNPRRQALPALPGANPDGTMPYRPDDINNLVSVLPPDLQTGGPLLRRPVQNMGPDSFRRGRTAASEDEGSLWDSFIDFITPDPEPQTYSAPTTGPMATPGGDVNNTMPGGSSSSGDYPSTNYPEINTDADGQFVPGNINPDGTPVKGGPKTDMPDDVPTTYITPEGETTDPPNTVNPQDIFNPDDLTPFQAFDRQRFAAPGQNTVRGEGILAGRYDQRFGPEGTDPFAAANQAVGTAANYQSGFQGTTSGIGGQAGNYQANLANASNPGVFQSRDYTAGLQNFANPNAGVGNVNQGLSQAEYGSANQGLTANQYGNATSGVGNVNANVRSNQYGNANQGLRANQYGNVNQGIQAAQYGNVSQGLQGTQNYNRNYQDLVQQSFNPFQDQVVNQTIKDLDRARQITNNEISGSAAKAGAFGGSREALMRAENNRNFFDRVGSAVGQLRSQGFESAANRASQENLQRLGLTASDVQNVRGIQNQGSLQGQSLTADAERQRQALMSQGALQGQNLTAASQQQLNSLLSQGNLQGQNLGAASDQQANALRSQGALAAQDLQGRGALQGQNLTASAQNQLNSLLSQGNLQGQSLSASDLNNVRNLISQGGLAAQGLQSQGALAALGANADLYSRALGLNSASDLAALQANAGLLSDAMGLDAADLQQRRNIASTEAQFAENALRNAGALNLSGGQALGQLAQAGTADERQRIADMLAAGQAGDARNQQDLDFIFNEFNRELDYPGRQIDLRNAAISPATGSIVTTSQPRYQQNPILGGLGAAMGTYGMTSNPYLAGAAGILSLLG